MSYDGEIGFDPAYFSKILSFEVNDILEIRE